MQHVIIYNTNTKSQQTASCFQDYYLCHITVVMYVVYIHVLIKNRQKKKKKKKMLTNKMMPFLNLGHFVVHRIII